jgi:hypothetical protein
MAWQKLDGRNHPLEQIGKLTIRLLNLAVHQQISRGQEQLRAQGVVMDITPAKEVLPQKNKEKYKNLKIVEKGSF